MNEAQIAAKLQANIPRPEPQQSHEIDRVVKEANPANELLKSADMPNELSAHRLMNFFNVPTHLRDDRGMLDKLSAIYRWTASTLDKPEMVDVMAKLRRIERKLGLTYRQDEKVEGLYRYLKLDHQRRTLRKEMELI